MIYPHLWRLEVDIASNNYNCLSNIGGVHCRDRTGTISNCQLLSSVSSKNGGEECADGFSTTFENRSAIIFSNLIYIEPMQELPVIITDHIHSISSQICVEDDNLTKINPQQTVPNQIPNRISLNIINAQSICGPSGKTEDFIDHVTGQVALCAVTETFLTEHNNVTRTALHPSGYAFKDQQ